MAQKQMPEMFSRKWWRLWYSGAIDIRKTYLNYLADLVIARFNEAKATYPGSSDECYYYYYDLENVPLIRNGQMLPKYSRGLYDLSAMAAHDLRMLRYNKRMELVRKLQEELFDFRGWRGYRAGDTIDSVRTILP